MNKEFKYRGYEFNIKVELDVILSNGTRYHRATTTCMGYDNYYKSEIIDDENLVEHIKSSQFHAEEYVDKKLEGIPLTGDERLLLLGFK